MYRGDVQGLLLPPALVTARVIRRHRGRSGLKNLLEVFLGKRWQTVVRGIPIYYSLTAILRNGLKGLGGSMGILTGINALGVLMRVRWNIDLWPVWSRTSLASMIVFC
jgi:hypothetical protein